MLTKIAEYADKKCGNKMRELFGVIKLEEPKFHSRVYLSVMFVYPVHKIVAI
jgi:hypothetical protein